MNRLTEIKNSKDIFQEYRQTPIGLLLEYHNLNKPLDPFTEAQLLIGMCIDNRKNLNIPDNFAFIIRSGGANLKFSEFKISYAIAVGNIKHIALIAHNNCGMVNLKARKDNFISGLEKNAGVNRKWAEEHFIRFEPIFEIGNEIDFVISEAQRLRSVYPKIIVAPMFYDVDDQALHLINEN